MDCNNPEDYEKSEKIFQKAKTFQEFLKLWQMFYLNRICIPTYVDNFVGAEDNPQADESMARKFVDIVEYGVVPYDFQINSLADGQKAYVLAYVPKETGWLITSYINRYPGYVAFSQSISNDINSNVENLFATYDPDEDQKDMSQRTGVLFGQPFTQLGLGAKEDMEQIREWLSRPLKKIFNSDYFERIVVLDTNPLEKSDRILNIILNAIQDNKVRLEQIVKSPTDV